MRSYKAAHRATMRSAILDLTSGRLYGARRSRVEALQSLMTDDPSENPVVLLVEDDGLLLMEAADTLAEAGFTVLEAAHADKALTLLEGRDDVGVVMTDVDMPQGSMDGFALARLVSRRWPEIPVLVVSGMGFPGPNDMPDGARFISKPYQPSALVRTLRAVVRAA